MRTIHSAWIRITRLWRPMAAWTVLTWALVAIPMAPVSSYVLGLDLLRGSRAVVGNEELLAWSITLPGLVWILLAGGFGLMAAVIRYAGLFHILADDLEGRQPGLRQTFLDLAPRLPALGRLCLATVGGGAVLALLWAVGLLAIRATVLGEFDLNYYLAERPREWTVALGFAAGWTALIGFPTLLLLGRSVLALPAYLDGHEPLNRAIRESWDRTRADTTRVLRTLGAVVAVWLTGRAALVAAYVAAGAWIINALAAVTESLEVLLLATGTHLASLLILDALVGFLGFALVSTVLTKAYHEETDLHARTPREPGGRAPAPPPETRTSWIRPAVGIPAALVLVAGSVVASWAALPRVPSAGPVTITAHRAGPPPAPENTLAALEQAIEAGADWAEIDVQRTLDDLVVVVHDADLMRMAGDPRRIRDTPYADLAGVVQKPDDGSPAAERRVATLQEFLERSEDRIGLLIELKYYGPDPELAPAVARTVRQAGMTSEVRIMSLDFPAIRTIQQLAPRAVTGYVVAAAVGDVAALPVDFLAVSQGRITPRLIRAARSRGIEIHAWTVNNAGDMADLVDRGIDGLITDDPALARRVNVEMVDLSPASRLLLRFRDLWDSDAPVP